MLLVCCQQSGGLVQFFITFITALAWVGMFLGGLLLASRFFTLYHLNTPRGKLRRSVSEIRGFKLEVKSFTLPTVMLIVSICWLIAKYSN